MMSKFLCKPQNICPLTTDKKDIFKELKTKQMLEKATKYNNKWTQHVRGIKRTRLPHGFLTQ